MSQPMNQNLEQATGTLGALIHALKGSPAITADHLASLAEGVALIANGLQQMDQVIKQVEVDVGGMKQALAAKTAQQR